MPLLYFCLTDPFGASRLPGAACVLLRHMPVYTARMLPQAATCVNVYHYSGIFKSISYISGFFYSICRQLFSKNSYAFLHQILCFSEVPPDAAPAGARHSLPFSFRFFLKAVHRQLTHTGRSPAEFLFAHTACAFSAQALFTLKP